MNTADQPDPNAIIQQAIALHTSGKLSEASVLYRKLLELFPPHPVTLAYLGMAQFQLGDLEGAVDSLQKSVQIRGDQPEALSFLGSALLRLNRPEEALAAFDASLAVRPDFIEVLVNRGDVLRRLKRLNEALASCDHALSRSPDLFEALNNRGLVLQDLGRHHEALETFERALVLRPDVPALHSNLANSLRQLEQLHDALTSIDRAIALNPDAPEPHHNRGTVLQALGRWDEARASYEHAIALQPDYAEAWYGHGCALMSLVQPAQAAESFRRALSTQPDYGLAKWALAIATIPEMFTSEQDLEISRGAFAHALDDLDAWLTPRRMNIACDAVASRQPFYLAYQPQDNKALLSRYGEICNRVMAHWQQQRGYRPGAFSSAGKIRIGLVSAQIHDQSVWQAIIKGWIARLHPDRFEIHIFYPGTKVDVETRWAQTRVAHFTQGLRPLEEWARAILDARIEALIYPEIGMGMTTAQLANLRLAPVQLAAWGHPDTTGLKTIDYYISAEDFEPDDAERFYVEKLVKLPHLGCSYTPQDVVAVEPDFAALGLITDAPLLVCPGAPFKYAPQYDWVLVEIAKRLGKCRLVFFTYSNKWFSQALAARLHEAFGAAGLDFEDYGIFVPWLKRSEFYGLMERADVFLDTLGFSGFNTAIQAVECALPIAALDGRFMRGRLASGILKRMGMPELVASSEEGYISLAVRLAQNRAYRNEIRNQIKAKRGVLFDDPEPVRALETFLVSICRHRGP